MAPRAGSCGTQTRLGDVLGMVMTAGAQAGVGLNVLGSIKSAGGHEPGPASRS